MRSSKIILKCLCFNKYSHQKFENKYNLTLKVFFSHDEGFELLCLVGPGTRCHFDFQKMWYEMAVSYNLNSKFASKEKYQFDMFIYGIAS